MIDMHCCFKCKDRQSLCWSTCESYAEMKRIRKIMYEEKRNESVQNAHVLRARENFSRFHHKGKDRR